ncbi:fungal-specific transcription factor [Gigaspora rosea]|uniref:Fungal-specific transcription factor n=1 Tax=Gigaspora rosea TaxID=44941 RepID=A0A397W569_9GLOM|nr:fungal-specific transcription factor [Gigaspora rosea]
MLPFKRTYESTVDPEDIRDIEEIGSNQNFCSQQFQPRDFLQFQQQIFFNSHLYTQDDLSIINDFELYSQIQHPTSISVNVLDQTSSTSIDDKSSLTSEEFQRLKKIVDIFMNSNNSKKNSNISSSLTNRNSTSIILNFSTRIDEQNDIKSVSSLNSLINSTYLNYYYLVDLILKVSKNMNTNMNTNSTFLSQDVRSSKLTTYCIKDTTNDTPTFSPSGLSINPPLNDLCKNFINHYFKKLNPIIPIIDPKRFSDQCERKKTKHFELLVHSILAVVSARYPLEPSLNQSSATPASIFFNSAKKLLDTMYDTPRLETIQSLLLLSMSELIPSRFDNGYMLLGMAVQMAHLLRIDVIDNSLDPAENEERQRIYYCLYIRDRWHSFALAKPPSLDYVPNRVPLPKLISFSQLVKDHFIAAVELSHIVRRIWAFGYSPSSKISYEDWHHHLANPLSDLMKIRSELANWLKKLPNTLQYLYLPATDLRSIYQLASFSEFTGFLNILFHTCIILTHKFYIPQTHTAQNLKSLQHSPIQICLNSAIAIIDIAKTTREFDADAFYHFAYVIYGLLQATTVQLVIMNISKEYESIVKLSLENSIKELKLISKRCAVRVLEDAANELENIVKVINELKSSTEISQLSEFQDDQNNEAGLSSQ